VKTWDAAALAQLETGGGAVRALVTADFSDVTYRFIDEPVATLTLDGNDYIGVGDGISFSGIPSASGMQAGRFDFTIPSAALMLDTDATDPITVLSSVYDEDYKDREIDMDYAIFTSAPGEFVGIVPGISGRMVSAPLRVNPGEQTATLTLECQTLGQDFRRSNGGVRGSSHVRRFYPETDTESADEFGDFVVKAVTDKTIRWGLEGDGIRGQSTRPDLADRGPMDRLR
jgi:hypothetical protein